MELGNMVFGHSRGKYSIDRGIWQKVFFDEFIYKINGDGYGYVDGEYGYENNIFKIKPYDWDAECDCGFDELVSEWWEGKEHKKNCYQKLVDKELTEKGWTIDNFGYLKTPKGMSYDEYSKIEDTIREKYCKQFGLSFPGGCAIHCTCGLNDNFDEWVEDKDHKNSCRLVQPNFLYKPTGFSIMCYKYFLRDSYMNQNISLDEFKNILKECVKSYYKINE